MSALPLLCLLLLDWYHAFLRLFYLRRLNHHHLLHFLGSPHTFLARYRRTMSAGLIHILRIVRLSRTYLLCLISFLGDFSSLSTQLKHLAFGLWVQTNPYSSFIFIFGERSLLGWWERQFRHRPWGEWKHSALGGEGSVRKVILESADIKFGCSSDADFLRSLGEATFKMDPCAR